MITSFKSTGFERKLFVSLLCMSLIPLTVACAMFYLDSRQNLLNSADHALTAVTRQKANSLNALFDKWFTDLHIQAHHQDNIVLLGALEETFRYSNQPLAEFVQDYSWLKTTDSAQGDIQYLISSYGYHDLLMLDTQGNILFSAAGEKNLGNNLFTSQSLSGSLFAKAARKALKTGEVVCSDFELYQSSGGGISIFLVQEMISDQGEQVGLLALQITLSQISPLLADSTGLGESGETVLTGMDGVLRSNSRFSKQPTALHHKVNPVADTILQKINKSNTSEAVFHIPSPKLQKAPRYGKIVRLMELEKTGLSWVLFTRIKEREIFAPAHTLLKQTLFLFGITTLLIIILARVLASKMVTPVKGLNRWVQQVATGNLEHQEKLTAGGEFLELADNFGKLQAILLEKRREDDLLHYHKDGEATLNSILRGDKALGDLADQIISFVAEYTGAQVGAFFIRKGDRFILVASYAYKLRHSNDNEFRLGEGMVGQAALEKKNILFQNVPADHLTLRVDSGLGETRPELIMVVPLIYNDQVEGVLEFATSRSFSSRETEFLENMAQTVALALHTAQAHGESSSLLEETQRQSHALQNQQEELKSANEELEEQAMELRRSQQLLQDQSEELQAANEELSEKTENLERQKAELSRQKKDAEERIPAIPESGVSPLTHASEWSRPDDSSSHIPVSPTQIPDDDRYTISDNDKTALIIEDDVTFATILRKMASKKGYKVLLAESGQDGLLLAEKYLPQAIILDLGLPDMNGMQVLAALKGDTTTCHIPVHIASARDRESNILQKGAIGYLSKPATREEIDAIFNSFEQLLSGSSPQLLLVENDPVSRQATMALFQHREVDISSTGSGQEALELLSSHHFDAVILDPGLSDMETVTFFNSLQELPGIDLPPVVIYTDRNMSKEEMARYEELESTVVIKGPDSEERLLDEVSLFFHAVNSRLPEEKQQQIARHHAGDSYLSGRKILLVDDDHRNTFAVGKLLKKAGMVTITADEGRMALTQLTEHPDVDLILMDVMMPVMDGYEATQRIRAIPAHRDLPIIALTAKAMSDDRDKCLKAGASDYLAKPVEKEKLLSMIRVWMSNKR